MFVPKNCGNKITGMGKNNGDVHIKDVFVNVVGCSVYTNFVLLVLDGGRIGAIRILNL